MRAAGGTRVEDREGRRPAAAAKAEATAAGVMLGTRANVGWAGVVGWAGLEEEVATAWGRGRMAARVDGRWFSRLACADEDEGFEMAASR